MPATLHLSIESSGHAVSLAVGDADADTPRAAVTLPRQRRGQLDLMPRAAELIAASGGKPGTGPADLAAVSLALGPGSFTGLRVAVATAKMLAFTLDVKLVGIPTLDLLRAQHPEAVIALNVKRGTAWSAGPGLDPALRPLDKLRALGRPLVGDLDDAAHPADADVGTLYRLAHARLAARDYDAALALAPAYIREPEAVALWDQRHGSEPTRG